ncbi:hypothetical protein HRbin16_03301 [bacterium HR16]|nr:hypothetical protein HRbin16_03301 [bacterium HR16]
MPVRAKRPFVLIAFYRGGKGNPFALPVRLAHPCLQMRCFWRRRCRGEPDAQFYQPPSLQPVQTDTALSIGARLHRHRAVRIGEQRLLQKNVLRKVLFDASGAAALSSAGVGGDDLCKGGDVHAQGLPPCSDRLSGTYQASLRPVGAITGDAVSRIGSHQAQFARPFDGNAHRFGSICFAHHTAIESLPAVHVHLKDHTAHLATLPLHTHLRFEGFIFTVEVYHDLTGRVVSKPSDVLFVADAQGERSLSGRVGAGVYSQFAPALLQIDEAMLQVSKVLYDGLGCARHREGASYGKYDKAKHSYSSHRARIFAMHTEAPCLHLLSCSARFRTSIFLRTRATSRPSVSVARASSTCSPSATCVLSQRKMVGSTFEVPTG